MANIDLVPPGSLVIPMDNPNQAVMGSFNLNNFGLANEVIQNNMPLK